MRDVVYKVATTAEWAEARRLGRYLGSADDVRDGFIHLSTADQLAGTLARHFAGQTKLVLVAIEAVRLEPALQWEPARGGELFPHLYRDLDPSVAHAIHPLALDGDGAHILPGGLR